VSLVYLERPAAGAATGLLILHHGRGSDERDLLGLADALDPDRRWHAVTPRAPLTMSGWPGYHWYVVPRIGFPDPESFRASRTMLAAFHDETWERTGLGPEQTVLGGFSMGTVMSYTTGLSAERPAPAGILALSGFIPTVEDWQPSLSDRTALPVFIAHGRADPTISIEFARRARATLEAAGLPVEYHESDVGHQIDVADLPAMRGWLSDVVR
jgi:phospholipase/carboxylesterase